MLNVIGTDSISSYKSNYHTITTTTVAETHNAHALNSDTDCTIKYKFIKTQILEKLIFAYIVDLYYKILFIC